MSSYRTTVAIDDKEWQQIQDCVRNTDIYVAAQKQRIKEIRQETARRVAENAKLREQTLKTVNNVAGILGSSFRTAITNLENLSMDTVRAKSNEFKQSVDSLRNDIRQTGKKTAQIKEQLGILSRQYGEVVNQVIGQEQNAAKRAQIMLGSLSEQMEQIEQLQPEVYEPEKYREIKEIIHAATVNIKAGNYEAALITSQVSVSKANELLTELIIDNDIYDSLLCSTLDDAEQAKLHFEELSTEMEGLISFDVEGETFKTEYDIEYWSDGRFGKLKEEFQNVYEQIQDAVKGKVSINKLTQLKNKAKELMQKLQRCDAAARNELIGSLWAEETAARLFDVYGQDGWSLISNGFEDDDPRKPYVMEIEDPTGIRVPFVISPSDRVEKPDIFFEAIEDDSEKAKIIKENARSLMEQAGIHIEQTGRQNDCHLNAGNNDKDRSGSFVKRMLENQKKMRALRKDQSFR